MKTSPIQALLQTLERLRGESSGAAALEFALTLPLLVTVGGYGMEMSNLAITSMKVSQASMALADNMSRIGDRTNLSSTQIRESDIGDSFIGLKRQTGSMNLTNNGRVILSSLEQNASGGQYIRWQRCIGMKNVASSYGTQGTGATGTTFQGMGPSTGRVTAPPGTAVMFVEIKYDYQPLFTTMFIPARTITYEASFIVRDERDLTANGGTGVTNPAPAATVYGCGSFTA